MPSAQKFRLPADDPEVLLCRAEFAKVTGLSQSTIDNRLVRGAALPPSVKVARRRWWRSSDVRRWVLQGDDALASMEPFG